MEYLALALAAIALVILWFAYRKQQNLGMPAGRLIYADTRQWKQLEEALYDPVLHLTGRPDYLVQQGEMIIPVEVKSSRVKDAPYDSHIFQLAAYCLLVQRLYGKRPSHGILHYPNRTYAIDYTPDLEAALLSLLEEMQAQARRKGLNRSHEQPERCRRCGFRSICDQSLARSV